MKFYITGETYRKLKNVFTNLNTFYIIDVDTLIKDSGLNPLKLSHSFIINSEIERLISLVDKNKVVFGGKHNDEKIEPTILDNVTFDDSVMQEEIFGPLIPIITYNYLIS